jgi:hypothetical protein
MKAFKILIILFLLTEHSYSQKVKYISSYFSQYDKANEMNYFKIGKHTLSFNDKEVFVNGLSIIKKDTASFFFIEVYQEKVLLITYYPSSQAHVSTGPGFRPIQEAEFISLKNTKRRWHFDLKAAFNSASIVNFDEVTGELEVKRKIKGKAI